jgi:peptidoglycan/xylan/chitin deacetylase (PgdA/CDA1 family)
VIYYHSVFAHERERFAAQLDCIGSKAEAIAPLSPKLLAPGKHYVAVTVDDAFRSFYLHGLPEVERRKMPAAVFVPTNFLGQKVEWEMEEAMDCEAEAIMTQDELRVMAKSGLIECGSHTANHRNLSRATEGEAVKELSESKDFLEKFLGRPVKAVSFPYGGCGERDLRLARALGYSTCFSTAPETIFEKYGEGLIGRVRVEPADGMLEFKLKILGAYRWQAGLRRLRAWWKR